MLKNLTQYIAGAALAVVMLTSCTKDYPSIEEIDNQSIQEYLSQNNLNMTKHTFNDTSEFYYQIVKPGTGPVIEYTQQVPLLFSIKSLDGRYSSLDTFSNRYASYLGYFALEPVRIAVKELLGKKNGQVRVIIPSRFAYGRNGSGDIPGNASLDITVSVRDEAKLPAYEEQVIQEYLQKNGLTGFSKTASGIYYKIAAPGTGDSITVDSTVTVKYTGRLLNGTVFDKSEAGTSMQLRNTILGWQEAVPLIRQGGSMRIIVPYSKAYGISPINSPIPPFSSLDFDIAVTEK
ncbi:MAG TPA: FKBP-type peptidyl-prolyl cis-trans isomerase [Sphingobacteriaceae bacterium]